MDAVAGKIITNHRAYKMAEKDEGQALSEQELLNMATEAYSQIYSELLDK